MPEASRLLLQVEECKAAAEEKMDPPYFLFCDTGQFNFEIIGISESRQLGCPMESPPSEKRPALIEVSAGSPRLWMRSRVMVAISTIQHHHSLE
jgi:hypothetical protein